MGLIQRRTNLTLGSIGSTKVFAVDSETLYQISSGYVAVEIINLGDSNVFYGNAGVTNNSGGLLTPKNAKFWDNISDDFKLYFFSANSSYVVAQEYEGR